MRQLFGLAVALVAASACKDPPRHDNPNPTRAVAETKSACAGATAHGPLPWFEDDYAAALACAKEQAKPLVLDMWAPWCHTCVAMKTTVLVDASLAPLADRAVFAAIDTDKPENAPVVARYPLQNWPTFFVIDPTSETVQARWLGAASVGQLRQLIKDGETAVLSNRSGAALDPLLAGVRAGAQAANQKDWAAARAALAAVLRDAPSDWTRRSDVLVSLISATYKAGAYAECVQLAAASIGQTGNTANATDFAAWGLECAEGAGVEPAAAQTARQAVADRLAALVDDAQAPLSADDRSDAMMNLRNAYDTLGKKDLARATAERQLAFLTKAAAEAPDAFARMTFNWPRAEVHIYLERGAELVPDLEQSARDLPTEYDPPNRLAWVLWKMGAPERALAPAKAAAGKAYGTRKVRVQNLVVDIAKALGDKVEEKAARLGLVAVLEGLPPSAAQPEALAKAKAELAQMDAPATDAGVAAPR